MDLLHNTHYIMFLILYDRPFNLENNQHKTLFGFKIYVDCITFKFKSLNITYIELENFGLLNLSCRVYYYIPRACLAFLLGVCLNLNL